MSERSRRPRRTILVGILAVGSFVPVTLIAVPASRADDAGVVPGADRTAIERVIAEQRRTERRLVVLGRVRAAYPQRLAAGVAAMVVRQPADWDCATVCEFSGPLLRVEPGLDGLRLGAGYGSIVGETREHPHVVGTVFLGWGVEGAVLRTWRDAPVEPAVATWVGAAAGFTITRVNVSVGVFRRAAGDPPGDRWLATVGLGLGF